jgi:uncharacterized tellurite resistance protein B-like protein
VATGKSYPNLARTQINLLVQLARVDGVVVQDEIDLINTIGTEYGLTSEEISACFDNPDQLDDLDSLTDDERYELIYNMVMLMKIDGRLYKEEIQYCARLAVNLGYEEAVLQELMLKIYSDPHLTTDKAMLKGTIQKYLKR